MEAKDTGLNGAFVQMGTPALDSPFSIDRGVELQGADMRDSGLGDGQAERIGWLPRGVMGSSNSWRGLGAALGMCLPGGVQVSATVGRLEFEQDGKRGVVVKAGPPRSPKGVYPLRLGRWFEGEIFPYFVNIACCQGIKDGWKECMESCAVTRRFLPSHLTGGKVIKTTSLSLCSDKLSAILSQKRNMIRMVFL